MPFGSIEFWCLKTFFSKRIFRCFFICCGVYSFLCRKILVNSVIYIEPFWCCDCERVYYFDFFFFLAFFGLFLLIKLLSYSFPPGARFVEKLMVLTVDSLTATFLRMYFISQKCVFQCCNLFRFQWLRWIRWQPLNEVFFWIFFIFSFVLFFFSVCVWTLSSSLFPRVEFCQRVSRREREFLWVVLSLISFSQTQSGENIPKDAPDIYTWAKSFSLDRRASNGEKWSSLALLSSFLLRRKKIKTGGNRWMRERDWERARERKVCFPPSPPLLSGTF